MVRRIGAINWGFEDVATVRVFLVVIDIGNDVGDNGKDRLT